MHTHYILCTYMRQTMTYTSLMKYCTHIIPYTARRSYIHPYHNTHLYYVCTLLTVYFALKPSQPCIITQSHNFQPPTPSTINYNKNEKEKQRDVCLCPRSPSKANPYPPGKDCCINNTRPTPVPTTQCPSSLCCLLLGM